MEERLPPSKYHTFHLPAASSPDESYVVQVPRDVIYRVPPPEHAGIVENHNRMHSSKSKKTHRRVIFWTVISILLLVVLLVVALQILRATLYNPKPPEFSVRDIQVKHLEQFLKHGRPSPIYTIALRASNPNARMAVSYEGGSPASLTLKMHRIGRGKIPSSFKPNGVYVDFQVAVSGKPPEAIKKSLKGTAVKRMALKAEMPVEISSWARTEKWDLKIYCDFKVANSLMHKTKTKTKIASQECYTEH